MNNESTVAIQEMLADYYRTFSTLNLPAILPFFHEPAFIIGPLGPTGVPNAAALEAIFAPTIQDLRARGYGLSEYDLRHVRVFSATAAATTGIAIRYKTGGQELERVGITYVLHKTGERWKIAVMVLHDADRDS
jgi:ketosteroid isomerase-like protein